MKLENVIYCGDNLTWLKKLPFKALIDEGKKFLKILDNFDLKSIEYKNKQFFKDNLLSMKNRIQNFLNKLNS